MAKKTHYQTLQVDPSADPDVIQAAYKRLAFKNHPDTNTSDQATHNMQEINEAYRILSDPAERTRYDQFLSRPIIKKTTQGNPSSASQEHHDRMLGSTMILNFISAAMLISVLVGYIFRKIGLAELIIIIVLAAVLTLPRFKQVEKYFKRKK